MPPWGSCLSCASKYASLTLVLRAITSRLVEMARDALETDSSTRIPSDSSPFPVAERHRKVEQWLQDTSDITNEDEAPVDADGDGDGDDEDDDPAFQEQERSYLPTLQQYRDLVFASVAYRWLLGSLTTTVKLSVQGDDFRAALQSQISRCIGRKGRISRRRASDTYSMVFLADWDPKSFLRGQTANDTLTMSRLLGEVPTLTGSVSNAQILPSAEYLDQTWPSTGKSMLELLKRAVVFDEPVSGEHAMLSLSFWASADDACQNCLTTVPRSESFSWRTASRSKSTAQQLP